MLRVHRTWLFVLLVVSLSWSVQGGLNITTFRTTVAACKPGKQACPFYTQPSSGYIFNTLSFDAESKAGFAKCPYVEPRTEYFYLANEGEWLLKWNGPGTNCMCFTNSSALQMDFPFVDHLQHATYRSGNSFSWVGPNKEVEENYTFSRLNPLVLHTLGRYERGSHGTAFLSYFVTFYKFTTVSVIVPPVAGPCQVVQC